MLTYFWTFGLACLW